MRRSGGSFDTYLSAVGRVSPRSSSRDCASEAAASVAGELVLEAAADQLGIAVPRRGGRRASFREPLRRAPTTVIEQAREAGAYETAREDVRLRGARPLAAEVKRIPPEQAEAREQIWTPEKEKPRPRRNCGPPVEGSRACEPGPASRVGIASDA